MNRTAKIILGVLSVIPIGSLLLLLAMTARALKVAGTSEYGDWDFFAFLRPYSQFMWMGLILAALLVITYLIIAIRDNNSNEAEKSRWITLLILLNYVAIPIYWWQRIWTGEIDLSRPTDRQN